MYNTKDFVFGSYKRYVSMIKLGVSILYGIFNQFSVSQANNELIGPEFHHVPPFNVQFSNDTGAKIDCTAFGNPTPQIQWYLGMMISNH